MVGLSSVTGPGVRSQQRPEDAGELGKGHRTRLSGSRRSERPHQQGPGTARGWQCPGSQSRPGRPRDAVHIRPEAFCVLLLGPEPITHQFMWIRGRHMRQKTKPSHGRGPRWEPAAGQVRQSGPQAPWAVHCPSPRRAWPPGANPTESVGHALEVVRPSFSSPSLLPPGSRGSFHLNALFGIDTRVARCPPSSGAQGCA